MSPDASTTLLALLDEPVLRVIPPGTGPFAGEVVAHGCGPAVRVDAATAVALWRARGEHVASALDVVRTSSGHAVVMPQCVESIAALATRRAAAGAPLSPGEVVTLAVSVVRGTLAEHEAHGRGRCRGRWWLSEDGTPLFLHDDDAGDDASSAGGEALRAIQASCGTDGATADALHSAVAAVEDPDRLAQAAASVEEGLFALAPAAPVRTQVPGRRRRSGEPIGAVGAAGDRPAWRRLADAADGGVAEMVSEALTQLWRAVRRGGRPSRGSRHRVVLLPGACGALVLAAGLLWPGATEEATPPAPRASPEPTVADVAVPSPETDAVAAAAGVLDAIRACGDDPVCVRPLQDQGAVIGREGAAFAEAAARTLTLLDDVGGLVLVRANDSTGTRPAQIVEILRTDEKWVLRDIHDVAQHPG